jgi:AAHS family 3-hydroxyphenylpropionic acid transporter
VKVQTSELAPAVATGAATTIGLCFAVAVLEGLDIQAMGVAAPKLGAELQLTRDALGQALSSSNIGLVVGASLGGWLADKLGRKPVLIAAVLVFGAFTLATMWAFNYQSLFAIRLGAGLGFGAALSNLMAMAAEVSSQNKRGSTGAMMFCGMPVGGGTVALISWLTPTQDWRMLFLIGGIAPLLIAPALALFLQETRSTTKARTAERTTPLWLWLAAIPLYGAMYLAATYAANVPGAASLAEMAPWLAIPPTVVLGYAFIHRQALFSEGRAFASVLIWLIFLPTLLILYLVLNWLPTLVVAKGFPNDASQASVWFNYVSVAGALLFGLLVDRFGVRWPLVISYAGLVVTLFLLSGANALPWILILSGVLGFFLVGANYSLYGAAASYYPGAVRGRGSGAAIAWGRLGSIAGPLVGGYLLASGATPGTVVYSMVPFAVLAGVSVLLLSLAAKPAE